MRSFPVARSRLELPSALGGYESDALQYGMVGNKKASAWEAFL